jgi:hypothetical protein
MYLYQYWSDFDDQLLGANLWECIFLTPILRTDMDQWLLSYHISHDEQEIRLEIVLQLCWQELSYQDQYWSGCIDQTIEMSLQE